MRLSALSLCFLAALAPSKCAGVSLAPLSPQRAISQAARGSSGQCFSEIGPGECQDVSVTSDQLGAPRGAFATTLDQAMDLLGASDRLVFADPARMVPDGEMALFGGKEEQTAANLQRRYGELLTQLAATIMSDLDLESLDRSPGSSGFLGLFQRVKGLSNCLNGQSLLLAQAMEKYSQAVGALRQQRKAVDDYNDQFSRSQVALSELHEAQGERYVLQQRRDHLQSLYAMDAYLAQPGSVDTLKNSLQSEEEPYDDDLAVMKSLAQGLPDPLVRRPLTAAILSLQFGRIKKLPAEQAQYIEAALNEYRAPSEQQLEERQRLLEDCEAQLKVHDEAIAQLANVWRTLCQELTDGWEATPNNEGQAAQAKRDFDQTLADFRLSEQYGQEAMKDLIRYLSSSSDICLAIQQVSHLTTIFGRILSLISETFEVVASGRAIKKAVEPLPLGAVNARGPQGDSGLDAE